MSNQNKSETEQSDLGFFSQTEGKLYKNKNGRMYDTFKKYKQNINTAIGKEYEQFIIEKMNNIEKVFYNYNTNNLEPQNVAAALKCLNGKLGKSQAQEIKQLEIDLKAEVTSQQLKKFDECLNDQGQIEKVEFINAITFSPEEKIHVSGEIKLTKPIWTQLEKQLWYLHYLNNQKPQLFLLVCNNSQDYIKKNIESLKNKHDLEFILKRLNIEMRIYYSPSHIEKLSKDYQQKMGKIEKEIKKREIENNNLNGKLENLQQENQEMKEENKEMKEENKEMKEENKEMKEENKEMKEENKEMKEENKKMKEENKKMQADLQSLYKMIEDLNNKVKEQHNQLKEQRNQLKECQNQSCNINNNQSINNNENNKKNNQSNEQNIKNSLQQNRVEELSSTQDSNDKL